MSGKRVSTADAWSPISGRVPFRTHGAMAGDAPGALDWMSRGQLVPGIRDRFADDIRSGRVTFVVRSYATPIAWHVDGEGWIVPSTRYSRTTSAHQGQARRGAQASGEPVRVIGADRLVDASTGGGWGL